MQAGCLRSLDRGIVAVEINFDKRLMMGYKTADDEQYREKIVGGSFEW